MTRGARNNGASIARDSDGAAVVEFALSVPILTLFMWGLFQFGMVLLANAGAQSALGEGARLATVYVPANSGPPSDDTILAQITSHKFGTQDGTWSNPSIVTDTVAGTKTITVTYSQPTSFLFFQGPTVTFTKTKVVNLSTS
jgi:Flp pilus assembly protein TadG